MIRESVVRDFNPWWKDPDSILGDKKIREWKNSEIMYIPRLQYEITYNFEPTNTVVYTLCGLRQVGKTTLVKLQIKKFLQNISPWNILYYSLDLANIQQDVVDVIEIYMKISERPRGDNRCYIFLDKVSSVHDWQKGIKWLVDNDKLKNCTVMATGSHAINIRNAERLPGRRGILDESYDKILLPMAFSEYASLLNKNIRNLISDNLDSFQSRKSIFDKLLNREIDAILDILHAYQNELNDLLREYMLTGGIPKIIDEKIKTNTIHESLYTNYLEGVRDEWSVFSKNVTLLKQFCGAIIKSQGSHTSWNNLSKEASLGSSNTASDYAYTLKGLSVLSIIFKYGIDKKIPLIKKDRKFYFTDPYFLHIFNGWSSAKGNFETSLDYVDEANNQTKIVEGIVADHLIRWAFVLSNKKQTFDYNNHVFYWKDDKGREVDFVLYDGNTIQVPIEVKYRNKINTKELTGLVSFLGKTDTKSGLVISKSTLEIRPEYVIIPASVFLLLI